MAQVNCIVVTPEHTALDEHVDFVALPLYDGEIGIAPGHSPLIAQLGFGQLRLRSGSDVRSYYVDGGFVQVADNVVSVLTARAIAAGELDPEVVQEQLDRARQQPAHQPDQLEAREQAVAQARAMLRVARRAHVGA